MHNPIRRALRFALLFILPSLLASAAAAQSPEGYYRFPTIHGDTIVFTAEGDLWVADITGGVASGVARRLTSHPGEESMAAISPDGQSVAFSAQYEGPTEVYVMPLAGGTPRRLTWEGESALAQGWSPDGRVLYSTRKFATLPVVQLALLDPATGARERVALNQASDGAFGGADGKTLFFTRLPFQGSHTKRYKGGTAQKLWKYLPGADEALPLTADFDGTSKRPMPWNGRVYFASDRDGVMNIWSMNEEGADLRQHTTHRDFDVQSPSLSEGRVVYQLGADLWLLDLASGADAKLAIRLASDFDQTREKWVKNPMEYLASAHISPSGDRVALTARGQVFTAPVGQGRLAQATRDQSARHRDARFMPDGKSLLALSDKTGELEFWKLPANGAGEPEQTTKDGKVFRGEGFVSPDGRRVAWTDKNLELWVHDFEKKEATRAATSADGDIEGIAWSPDSRWLAFARPASNSFNQILLYNVEGKTTTTLTSDRVESRAPAWSPDGKWIYFVSDRGLNNAVANPWGPRQPDPYFDKTAKIYLLALRKDLKNPFEPKNELAPDDKKDEKRDDAKDKEKEPEKKEEDKDKPDAKKDAEPKKEGEKKEPEKKEKIPEVVIDLEGLQQRLYEAPYPAGNYSRLAAGEKRLYWLAQDDPGEQRKRLQYGPIDPKDNAPKTLAEDVKEFGLSLDRKKILVRKADSLHVIAADSKAPADLGEGRVNLDGWSFSFMPRDEWRQMFAEAWRLERDYFYDPGMHGVDWKAALEKYRPLVDRVTDRAELSDLIAQMVGELSALHIFVRGGEMRKGADDYAPASLGALLVRDEPQGGWRVERIYEADPDYPEEAAPLAKTGLGVKPGDVIEAINGVPTLSAPDPAALLRNQAGRQVLVKFKTPGAPSREAIVVPRAGEDALRYADWEYSRRRLVEEWGGGEIGYVHLRAMGGADYTAWARQFYPVFNRKGLVIDVRNNRGGNIDSWILSKLMRRAWFYWKPRAGNPYWNMQFAFRGPMVALCNEHTASDGEAFTEGFRRLGLGKAIGTRTWGGEVWLSYDNWLVDKGIASAAEIGVYGPEGQWLIEGRGVEPDIEVDNLPRATFNGDDAQLKAAVEHLKEEIRQHPNPTPPPPPRPNKSFQPTP